MGLDDFGIRIKVVHGVEFHSSDFTVAVNIFPFIPLSVYPGAIMFQLTINIPTGMPFVIHEILLSSSHSTFGSIPL